MGRAINKTVMIAELIKRRIAGLHQNTSIGSMDITDTWEPLEEGLLPLETTHHVSVITITLSKKELDTSSAGNTKNEPRQVNNENLFAIWSYDGKMVYESIIETTENFSTKHCVGDGGCGIVYQADLTSGQVVAVKKLHVSPDGDLANLKGFTSEIRALTKICHHNIVKLYGYCSHQRHSFLVYEFLEGGSLGKILSMEDHVLYFDWIKRVNVVKDVANALSYMHRDCSPAIIH
ncbi:hypothetical protein ACSBR2_029668 [Camellia fascicularis]